MLKKFTTGLLAAILLFGVVPFMARAAQQEKIDVYKQQRLVKSVVFRIGLNEYFVNNQVPGVKMDVAPFTENGRTFVPVRYLSNALGVKNENIFWFGDSGLVKLQEPGFPTVGMTVGKVEVLSDGQPLEGVDVAPMLRNDRTFLPARFVAQALGYEVAWDEQTQTVICWPKGESKPDISQVINYLNESKGAARVLTEEDIKRLQGYAVYDRINPSSPVPSESFRSFEQMQADDGLRKNAELVVKNFSLDKVLSGEIRERTVTPDGYLVDVGVYEGQKLLKSLREYGSAKLEWLTDPRLVYTTAYGEYGIRGVLLVTFSSANQFGLTPGQTYEQDVEFRVINSLDWDTGKVTEKLDQIVLLSDFRVVGR